TMATTGPSRILVAVLFVVILVVGGAGFYAANYYLEPHPVAGPATVQVGANVTVNYIGYFGSGPQIGKVFDTSIYSVYQNNASYPKSLEFASGHSGAASAYHPLGVHIGPATAQYTVGNQTFSGVVPGFWQGIVGMTVNQTRYISMPPSLAYGPLDPACEATEPLAFTVPVLRSYTVANFSAAFPGISTTGGTTFPDPVYGWTDQVFASNTSAVSVVSLPSLGETMRLSGWSASVTGVNGTTITVTNDITPQNFGSLLGTFPTARACGGGASTSHYLIAGVNVAAGTFTINWNTEVTGQSLVFRVTLVALVTP
ncbi:peptidyl-prolyl cis-trans isomerase, FKBP-type, partial [mine drainage metagenome]